MAVARGGVFVDTSVLLAGLIDVGPASRPAQAVMDRVAAGRVRPALTAWHCCLEFFSVATRLPPEYRLAVADALTLIRDEVLARFDVQDLPAASRRALLEEAAADRIRGGRIYDAHIAAVASAAGAALVLTDNRRHFLGLLRAGIQVQTPAEFLGLAP